MLPIHRNILKISFFLISLLFSNCYCENVLLTEVFEITVNPPMFNWTYEDFKEQYVYQPSLLNSPDLPPWIHYVYSDRHSAGFLYGVPPPIHTDRGVTLEIIALNRRNYETRRHVLPIYITEKRNPAKYEVQMKIDNLNVDDMFEVERMDRLKDLFRKKLWKDSAEDLYITFLESAVELGARLPLDPKQGDGVVIRIGSTAPLSNELVELQEEVRPLWKLFPCPRNLKRTTVERYFRDAGFALDWCAFRLLEDNNSAMQQSSHNVEDLHRLNEHLLDDKWRSISIEEVPERSYVHEFMFTILVPVFLLTLLALLLSLILCFHHEGIYDPLSEDYFENIFHICTDYLDSSKNSRETATVTSTHTIAHSDFPQYSAIKRASQCVRSNPELVDSLTGVDSHYLRTRSGGIDSPTSTVSRGIHCRPSPPPYVKPKYRHDI